MPKQIFQLESGMSGPQCPGAAKKLDGFDGKDAFVAGSVFEEFCDLLPGLVFLFWGKIYDQPIGLHHALNNFHKFLLQKPLNAGPIVRFPAGTNRRAVWIGTYCKRAGKSWCQPGARTAGRHLFAFGATTP